VGICGSCSVHIDGQATRSCITPASSAEGKEITTIEGLATVAEDGTETLHPVQQAFIDEQVPQCSWCMSGQMMTAAAFLASPLARGITGEVLHVDRGYHAMATPADVASLVTGGPDQPNG